ncbi:MAG TPA: hypothetical protein VKE51_21015 [Vicinamibacterales bacterium]|nr:hypothetical protein [Vicinamibacterales bacterium]
MTRVLRLFALTACFSATTACQGTTTPSAPPGPATITFNGLTAGAAVGNYTESGFTISATPGNWIALTTYGNPAPFIEFFVDAGSVTGQVAVFADGHTPFRFQSVDLYSSVTRIPYDITGVRSDAPVFTVSDTLPNTFGNFRTVVNPDSADLIDTLIIRLTNSSPGRNPMGLDNIVLTR